MSVEIKIGTMVAPGVFFSTAFYDIVSGGTQVPVRVSTNLHFPPPLPSVNISINTNGHVGVSVVALGLELEVWCEVMMSEDFANASKYIAVEELGDFTVNLDP